MICLPFPGLISPYFTYQDSEWFSVQLIFFDAYSVLPESCANYYEHGIHSFNKYLLGSYCAPGTVRACEDTAVNKTDF